MGTENRYPYNYNWEKRFDNIRCVGSWSQGAVYTAEKNGKYYVVVDESIRPQFTLTAAGDFNNDRIGISEFETIEERDRFLEEVLGGLQKEKMPAKPKAAPESEAEGHASEGLIFERLLNESKKKILESLNGMEKDRQEEATHRLKTWLEEWLREV